MDWLSQDNALYRLEDSSYRITALHLPNNRVLTTNTSLINMAPDSLDHQRDNRRSGRGLRNNARITPLEY
jgi:hypothetical protein